MKTCLCNMIPFRVIKAGVGIVNEYINWNLQTACRLDDDNIWSRFYSALNINFCIVDWSHRFHAAIPKVELMVISNYLQ